MGCYSALSIVMNRSAVEKCPRSPSDSHTFLPERGLDDVCLQIADAGSFANDAVRAAIDRESIQGNAVGVLNIHDRNSPSRSIVNRGSRVSNQRESVKALNQHILFAGARDSDHIWPLWVEYRGQCSLAAAIYFQIDPLRIGRGHYCEEHNESEHALTR